MAEAIRLTGPGMGAIAVVLVAGDGARQAVERIGGKVPAEVGGVRRARLTTHEGAAIDDGLVVRVAEDRFELHLHGGTAVVDAVIEALRNVGARVRTISHLGKILGGGIEAEVDVALSLAATETGVRLLANQISAGLDAWLRQWTSKLHAGASPTEFASAAQWLLDRSATLDGLLTPKRVAIVGPPNAGKSTLANALLGRPVSITSGIPGTTRDWVDATAVFTTSDPASTNNASFSGVPTERISLPETAGSVAVPLTLVDTAGIRQTADAIEIESIRRTRAQLAAADAALVVVDAALPVDQATQALIAQLKIPTVLAANKVDALTGRPVAAVPGLPQLQVSALTCQGLAELMQAVLTQLDLADIGLAEPWVFTRRQRDLLERAALAHDVAETLRLLAKI